jgi:hypothetical protein
MVSIFTFGLGVDSQLSAQDNNPLKLLQAPSEPVKFEVLDLSATSLRFASEDTSFYSASFQLGKQWDAFLQSEFATHLLNSHVAKKWIEALDEKWKNRDGEIGQARRQLDNPNINSVIKVFGDLFHDEVFVYGDSRFPDTMLQINQLSHEVQVVVAASAGDQEQVMDYLRSLDKARIDQIQVPTIVFGGKLANKDLAVEQLSILEALLTVGLGQVPPPFNRLADGFEHTDDEGGTRISMTLRGSMIPWDQLAPFGEFVDEFQRLIEDRSFAITLGMVDDYLVFAISESKDDVPALREVSSKLADSSKLSLVGEKSKLPILAISYSSDELNQANFDINLKDYFSRNVGAQLTTINTMLLSQIEDADDEEETQRLQKIIDILQLVPDDLQWLDEQIGQHVPKFLGQTGVAVARPDGMESWVQYRTQSVIWDSQPKLPVLDHLGGKPLGFIAARRQYHPEYFETCRRIAQKVHTYLEKISESEVMDDEEEQEHLDTFLEKGWPLLVKFADIIEQDIIPNTKDGQFAVALTESNIKATKFANDMPASKQDLPLPEFTKILGTNDSEKLIDGFEKLYDLNDEVVQVVRDIEPDAIPPEYNVPRPESRSNPAGSNFFYPVPKDLGIPTAIVPQALFAKDFAYFSYSDPQVATLVKTTPLSVTTSFFKEHQSIAAVMYLDVGRVFEQFKPWFVYGLEQDGDEVIVPANDGFPEVRKSDLQELYDAFTKIGEFVTVESGSDSGSVFHGRHFR